MGPVDVVSRRIWGDKFNAASNVRIRQAQHLRKETDAQDKKLSYKHYHVCNIDTNDYNKTSFLLLLEDGLDFINRFSLGSTDKKLL